MADKKILSDPSLLIVLATSPTGLGHLRVVDALCHGLPHNVAPVLLGAQDPLASSLYRSISTHGITRKVMEKAQVPPLDAPFAAMSRLYLRSHTDDLYEKLKALLSERLIVPKVLLFVAPHTVLAHQFGAIKKRFEKETGVRSLLAVQVTDDAPQPVWYIPDADLLFVPSHYTKNHLMEYAKKSKLPQVPIIVTAYPVSPLFAEEIAESAFTQRLEQVTANSTVPIHMSVPVSGAAVGTTFLYDYLVSLHQILPQVLFHTVIKDAKYTKRFIEKVQSLPFVQLSLATHDRTTVDNYERIFHDTYLSLEITKPSEQAFKALLTPRQRGGVILLFAKPVGGQEYDNLHFLRTHGLMPSKHENEKLWELAVKKDIPSDESQQESHHWSALLLPDNPDEAAIFTHWCKEQSIFSHMMSYKPLEEHENLKSNGVDQFWSHVSELVEANKEFLS